MKCPNCGNTKVRLSVNVEVQFWMDDKGNITIEPSDIIHDLKHALNWSEDIQCECEECENVWDYNE